jgi:hypothetical protein
MEVIIKPNGLSLTFSKKLFKDNSIECNRLALFRSYAHTRYRRYEDKNMTQAALDAMKAGVRPNAQASNREDGLRAGVK